ncbi:MAG: hypothetical protein M1816_006354 [Peltula sp. TS41687]|nr:MAG: hypothetical protein M1816_006354 [Peltula sp. TS41687]
MSIKDHTIQAFSHIYLGHRLNTVDVLEKGMRVDILVAGKKRGRRATSGEREAELVLGRIRDRKVVGTDHARCFWRGSPKAQVMVEIGKATYRVMTGVLACWFASCSFSTATHDKTTVHSAEDED